MKSGRCTSTIIAMKNIPTTVSATVKKSEEGSFTAEEQHKEVNHAPGERRTQPTKEIAQTENINGMDTLCPLPL